MLGTKGSEPAEGRALGIDRPQHRPALENLLLEPATKQLLDLTLEGVGALEGVKGELERTVFRLEPGLEEGLEPSPLLGDEAIGGLVVELHRRRLAVAKDIDVGDRLALARLDGGEDLVSGAGRITLPVRHGGKVWRQLGAEPMAQDGDDEVAGRRF